MTERFPIVLGADGLPQQRQSGDSLKLVDSPSVGDILLYTASGWVRQAAPSVIGAALSYDADTNKLSYQVPWSLGDSLRPMSGGLASTFDRSIAAFGNGANLTGGTLRLARIFLPKGLTVTGISLFKGGTGVATPTNCWFALFDSSRAKLGVTNSDSSTWSSNTIRSLNLASAFVTTYSGLYYLGVLIDAAAPGNLKGVALTSSSPAVAAPYLCGDSSSTGLTNAASCPSTAGAISASDITLFYAEVY